VRSPERRYGRCLTVVAAVVIAASAFAVTVPAASAHIFINGTWSYKYFTRSNNDQANANCNNNSNWEAGAVDPVSVILYQYGEYQRIFSHLEAETDFGPQRFGSDQVICATNDTTSYFTHAYWDDQTGHGNLGTRAHFRLWFAPHGHGANVDKWSIITPHHESCCSHNPDEDWEVWEDHVAGEMAGHHNIYWDHFYHRPSGSWRGFWQDGLVTRIGGLHDGAY
jgi:hypothetical protein